MENNLLSISSEIRKLASDFAHGAVFCPEENGADKSFVELEIINIVSEQLVELGLKIENENKRSEYFKKALSNMFAAGQVFK